MYSSSDLLNWDYRGRALSPINGTDISPDRVVERPKSVFNAATQEWVLWFHSDNSSYGLLQQSVATSPNVTGTDIWSVHNFVLRRSPGPYTFQDVFSPLGGTSQDFGLFQDADGE